jgi:hypothetical protein
VMILSSGTSIWQKSELMALSFATTLIRDHDKSNIKLFAARRFGSIFHESRQVS